ncbi:glycosyltransferase, partial [Akkermansiaceae bacterium]|nr:glycosyltransferase [Akkermansiaceae bacterium]
HFHNHKLSCPIGTHWANSQNCFACLERGGAKNVLKHKCKDNLIARFAYYVNYVIDNFAFSHFNRALKPLVLTRWYQKFLKKQKGFDSLVLYNTVSEDICEYRHDEPNEFSFVYIGRDSKSKGYSDFLEAAIAFPDIQFVSVGPKRQIDLDNLKEYGWMPREETYRILGRSSCLIAPYRGLETFGMTVLESVALGVPVITTNIYSVHEVFSHMKGVYIYSGEESLIDYVRQRLQDLRDFGRRESWLEFDRVNRPNALRDSLLRLWKI